MIMEFDKETKAELDGIVGTLFGLLKNQESVTGEELWLKFNGTNDYRNGYFIGVVRLFLVKFDVLCIEEPKPAEFIFRVKPNRSLSEVLLKGDEVETENKTN